MIIRKIKNIILCNAKIIGLLLLLCFTLTSYTQTLYAIVVAGTNMPGNTLKIGLTKSFHDITNEIELIPQYTNLRLVKDYLTGDDFSGNNLRSVVNNLYCNSNDVIIFYYIGHGFRYDNQTSQWPNLCVGYNDNTSVSFQWVINQLKSKGAKLTITVAECCNREIGMPEPVVKNIKGVASLSFNIRNPERYKELFENTRGAIIASSSKPGETSVVSDDDGAFFTEALTGEIKEQTGISNSADWNVIFEKAKKRTTSFIQIGSMFHKGDYSQHPQFVINVTGTSQPNTTWNGTIASNQNVFQQQPTHFQYNNFYQPQQFVVAKIVNFNNDGVFFLMSDNYIVKYNPYNGSLHMIGYRAASMQPQMFQWDFVNPISPYQTDVFGVDYQGFVWQFNNYYGWQRVGAVYY